MIKTFHTKSFPLNSEVSSSSSSQSSSSLLVLSPPGGLGESTAVQSALLGASVQWFLVSSPERNDEDTTISLSTSTTTRTVVSLSQDILRRIQESGGSLQVANAPANVLVQDGEALDAIQKWCDINANGLVCTLDGIDQTSDEDLTTWQDAIKLAAQIATNGVRSDGYKLVLVPFTEDDNDDEDDNGEDNGNSKGLTSGLFAGLLGIKSEASRRIPKSLSMAVQPTHKLRHGTLFGIPESSPNFSILIGGPQKNPILCDEYQFRNVRLDRFTGSFPKDVITSRQTLGQAAAQILTGSVRAPNDLSLVSLRGSEVSWTEEFQRVLESSSSSTATSTSLQGPILFSTSFSSVPSIERLTAWLATKWAPAVLRTYDIAAIRTGSRPVYARVVDGTTNIVEIVWQELIDMKETVMVGTLQIEVTSEGITAARGPGDPTKGYGTIRRKPLNGEAVVLQNLVAAASQAVEKGLAKSSTKATQSSSTTPPPPRIVSSLQSVATTATATTASSTTTTTSLPETGPRRSGARRSSEQTRGGGKKVRKSTESDSSRDEPIDSTEGFQ